MRERTTTTQQQQKKKRGLLLLFCMSRRRLAAQGKLGCFQTHLCVYVFVFPTATSRLSSICCFSEGKEPAGQNCDDKKTLYSSHWRRKTERLHIYICICTYREREVFFFFRCCRWHSLCQYFELCDFAAAAFTTHRLLKKEEERKKKHSTPLSH